MSWNRGWHIKLLAVLVGVAFVGVMEGFIVVEELHELVGKMVDLHVGIILELYAKRFGGGWRHPSSLSKLF